MFVRYFALVDRPFDEVARDFVTGAESWMPALAVTADAKGSRMLSELGFDIAYRRLSRRIDVRTGAAYGEDRVILVPLEWRSSRASALFPVLTGEIEIAMIGSSITQVGLSATYEPPFGAAGRSADRTLLHRVAEVTVKNFVDAIVKRLSPAEVATA